MILLLALIFLGPKKLPELASGLGKMIREVRKATADIKNEIELDDAIRKPLQELRDATMLPPEELKRRDLQRIEQDKWEREERERHAAMAAAGTTPEDPASDPYPGQPVDENCHPPVESDAVARTVAVPALDPAAAPTVDSLPEVASADKTVISEFPPVEPPAGAVPRSTVLGLGAPPVATPALAGGPPPVPAGAKVQLPRPPSTSRGVPPVPVTLPTKKA